LTKREKCTLLFLKKGGTISRLKEVADRPGGNFSTRKGWRGSKGRSWKVSEGSYYGFGRGLDKKTVGRVGIARMGEKKGDHLDYKKKKRFK